MCSLCKPSLLNVGINDSIPLLLPSIMGASVLQTVVSHVHFNEGLSMNWESSVSAYQLTVKEKMLGEMQKRWQQNFG